VSLHLRLIFHRNGFEFLSLHYRITDFPMFSYNKIVLLSLLDSFKQDDLFLALLWRVSYVHNDSLSRKSLQ